MPEFVFDGPLQERAKAATANKYAIRILVTILTGGNAIRSQPQSIVNCFPKIIRSQTPNHDTIYEDRRRTINSVRLAVGNVLANLSSRALRFKVSVELLHIQSHLCRILLQRLVIERV